MSQQDSIQNSFVLIRDSSIFYRGDCSLGNPEWTRDLKFAKQLSSEDAVKKQLELRNKGWIIIVSKINFNNSKNGVNNEH